MKQIQIILTIFIVVLITGCKRTQPIVIPPVVINTGPCPENYQLYTSDTFNFVKKRFA
jgi:hypothetical protein